ncbi:hypothetical protein PISL3812_04195 [Talaromyces islandicus]|uniref:Uncharacterized protein n=1 Tax=Talaromyces islandicus TaxID=28573 RepID=A0A0U1LUU0_TALIS|nr:hypothetical protein PISL3812_04195 [Talaromyces islandicus]
MRRSKSAPSVRRRQPAASAPESLDPKTARHHATKAASLAMTQAKGKSHVSHEERKAKSEDVTSASATTTIRRSSSIRFAQEAGLPNHHNATVSHNPSRVPRETRSSNEKHLLVDTCTGNEFQGFGNEEIFAPSSYRRLRKARSMFSTKSMRNNRGSETVPSTESPHTDYSLRTKSTETAADTHRSLRHSLSFFNGNSQTIRRAKSQHTMGARSRVSEEDYPIPGSHPSPHSRERRLAQKSLRPAPRAMRELSPDDDVVPATNGLHKKARALSLNIKKRLKWVFGRPGYVEDELPEEPAFGSPYEGNAIFDSPTTVGGTSPPILRPKQSFESIATSASRVTSWTNSTAGNTIKAKPNTGRNHLSTIAEGGHSVTGQHFGVPEMHESSKGEYQQGKKIDSQRVYSALMRHLGVAASKDGERVLSSGTVRGYPVITERSSSVQSQREGRSIRQMASDVSMKTARTSLPVDSRPESPQNHSSYSRYLETTRPVIPAKAVMHGGLPSKRSSSSLRESESPFFPSSASMKPKTPSPYRVAMNSIREIEDSDNDAASVVVKQAANTRRVSTSPSIYSRTPSGCAVSRDDLQHEIEGPMRSGMATIFDSQVPYRSPKKNASSPTANLRSKNSAEWKKWMDSQINNIAVFEAPRLSSPLDVRKHHRENAECDEEPLRMGFGTGTQSLMYTEKLRPKSSLSGLQNLNESQDFRLPTPVAERKLTGQSNFSRPLSRQSVGSFKTVDRCSVDGNMITRLYEDLNSVKLSKQQDIRDAPTEPTRSTRSIEISNSPNRRLAIKAAREARLNRSPGGLGTVRQVDDSKDVKNIQFRSIRGASPYATRNKENEMSPTMHKDQTAVAAPNLSGLHATTDGKRMVDGFLKKRRALEDAPDCDADVPAFI